MSSPAPVLDPKRTALLVMDFQQGVLQRMPGLGAVARAGAAGHRGRTGPRRDHQLRPGRVHRGGLGGRHGGQADGTEDPDEQTRDVLLGKVFPRRAQVIDTATLHTLLSP